MVTNNQTMEPIPQHLEHLSAGNVTISRAALIHFNLSRLWCLINNWTRLLNTKHIWQCDLELQLVNTSNTLTHAVTNESRTSATYRPCGLRYERKKESREKSHTRVQITHTHTVFAPWSWKKIRGSGQLDPQQTIPFEVNYLSRFWKKKRTCTFVYLTIYRTNSLL